MPLSLLGSKTLWLNRTMLWLLVICNAGGTAYGYIWYGRQLEWTAANRPLWQLPFVPDSPTASLFFTLALLFLLFPARNPGRAYRVIRTFIESMAVLTSVKYGIWAVVMNFAQEAQGSPLDWQNWMLIVSHAAMAVEALLYVRFFLFGRAASLAAFLWLLLNDTMDYSYGIYPWLPDVLEDDIGQIRTFTFGLTAASYFAARIAQAYRDFRPKPRLQS